jgi:hypothetical protein
LRGKLGDGVIGILREKMARRVKVPKAEEAEIAAHYRKELARMQALRKQGVTGRIEFESWQ